MPTSKASCLSARQPNEPVFHGGGSRPNIRFHELCDLAGVKPRAIVDTGMGEPWLLNDLRKTCATYYDAHVPESSIEILGHSVDGITYRHYAHRAPLAFKAIMTLPQPTAFTALVRGFDDECPCCRRRFDDAGYSRATDRQFFPPETAAVVSTDADWRVSATASGTALPGNGRRSSEASTATFCGPVADDDRRQGRVRERLVPRYPSSLTFPRSEGRPR